MSLHEMLQYQLIHGYIQVQNFIKNDILFLNIIYHMEIVSSLNPLSDLSI